MMFVNWTMIKEVPIQFCFIIQELEDKSQVMLNRVH